MLSILLSKDVECPLCNHVLKKDTMQPMNSYSENAEFIYIKCKQILDNEEEWKGLILLLEKDHQVFL